VARISRNRSPNLFQKSNLAVTDTTTSTVPEPTSADPAIVSPSDESQAVQPSFTPDTAQHGSLDTVLPRENVNGFCNPTEKTKRIFEPASNLMAQHVQIV